MIHFLAFMQSMFGHHYPLFLSAAFAATATYYGCFYESPDKIALTLLAACASLGWLCLHEAETILGRLIEIMDNTAKKIEVILNQPDE